MSNENTPEPEPQQLVKDDTENEPQQLVIKDNTENNVDDVLIPSSLKTNSPSEELCNIVNYKKDNDIEKILKLQLHTDEKDYNDLAQFCNNVIAKKFQESVKLNTVLTRQADSKTFNLKVYKTANAQKIKTVILDTLNNPNDEITQFISHSIDLILLEETKTLTRSIISLQNKIFIKLNLTAQYKTRVFKKNYYIINIEVSTINLL